MKDNRKSPHPGPPPQAGEGAHPALVFPLPLAGEGGALVRARRVGAASIGISRSHLNFEIPDRSALRTVRNDNNQTEDTP